MYCCFFFFQAEDGIRDGRVTGVQTCALPILSENHQRGRVVYVIEKVGAFDGAADVVVVVHQVEDADPVLHQFLAEAQVLPVVEKRERAVEQETEIDQEQSRLQRGHAEAETRPARVGERYQETNHHDRDGRPDQLADREGLDGRGHQVVLQLAQIALSAVLELPSSVSSEYVSTMRARAASCIARTVSLSVSTGSMPSTAAANASGSCAATATPQSPTIRAESPTSVTTHGRPQAIASAITLGKLSPYEVDASRSSAL